MAPCQLKYWPDLARIIRSSMTMEERTISYYLRHYLATTRVALLGDTVAGCCVFYETKDPQVAWLGILAVDPEFQGRGIGKELIRDLERNAAEQGYSRIEMSVKPANTGAQKFYEREGYARIDRPGDVFTYGKPLEPKNARTRINRPSLLEHARNRIAYLWLVKK